MSYYPVTAVQIDSSFVYYLSNLNTQSQYSISILNLNTQSQYSILKSQSTTLTLLSVCAIHITAHFTAHEAQILIFW